MNQTGVVSSRYIELESNIVRDVLPWEHTAYKVRWSFVFWSYKLLSEAPSDIDVFDAVKNSQNIWARYTTNLEADCKPYLLMNSLKKLKAKVKIAESLSLEENNSKAIKVNLDLLNAQGKFKSFLYVVKW